MRNFNLIDKTFLLKKTSLFQMLDLDLLLSIADKMESLHCRTDDKVFQYGQEANRMYVILVGEVLIEDKNGTRLAELSSGDFFGDEALFNEKKREYSARCKTRVELLTLSRSHLLSIINECPQVAISLLGGYASSLTFRAP